MLPRGQNRVGANRLGAKGEENKRRRKRERGRNRIVFDGVRIVRHACVHKLVDESSTSYPFSLSCQRRGCAILSLAFFRPKEGPSSRTQLLTEPDEGSTRDTSRKNENIWDDNVSRPSFNPARGNLESNPSLVRWRFNRLIRTAFPRVAHLNVSLFFSSCDLFFFSFLFYGWSTSFQFLRRRHPSLSVPNITIDD